MRKMVFSVFLCAIAQAAGAQCVPDAPASTTKAPADSQVAVGGGQLIKAGVAARDSSMMHKAGGAELAGGGAVRATQTVAKVPAAPAESNGVGTDEERPRTGNAMLLTALAVMLTIALRHGGASGR